MLEPLYFNSASALAQEIREGNLSSKEVVRCFINRIKQVNPLINAVIQLNHQALEQAEQADRAVKSKAYLGRLHGVPITAKDAFHVKGFKISKGCPALLHHESTVDSTAIARLKAEGAIILGITNTPELLMSYETENNIYGRTNNPYDLARTPGGSSGGEAAILAVGGSTTGVGTDAGGSLRQPAHYSGICAHKPTQGLVPFTGNIPSYSAGLVTSSLTLGPMARHVEDLILVMQIIAGADGLDPHTIPMKMENPDKVSLTSLRVAYFKGWEELKPTTETVQCLDKTIEILKEEGLMVKEDLPHCLNEVYRLYWQTFILGGDNGLSIKSLLKQLDLNKPSFLLEAYIKDCEQSSFTVAEMHKRLYEVEEFRYSMMRFMQNYDVVISPVSATPARYHHETVAHIEDFLYCIVHNLTGWPATVIPVDYSQEGLPIGVQIAAKPWNDHITLALAKHLQSKLGVFPILELTNPKSLKGKQHG